MRQPLAKQIVAEALGTFFLLAAVVGRASWLSALQAEIPH
jgi:glycerol uptake facilitator-like aquaporin